MKRVFLPVLLLLITLLFVVAAPVSADRGSNDRVVFGNSIVIDSEDSVDDLVVFGGSVTVLGGVNGDLVVFGGSTNISGQVQGDVLVFGGSTELKSSSVVGGDIVTFGGSVRRESGATVGGSTVGDLGDIGFNLPDIRPFSFTFTSNPLWGFIHGITKGLLTTIVFLGLAILAISCCPRQFGVTEDVLENAFWQSAGAGVLTWLVAMFLTPILIISLIGIPVAMLLWLALFVISVYSLIATASVAGERVMQSAGTRAMSPLMHALIGMLLIMLVTIPFNAISGGCLGTLLLTLLITPGIGAAVLSRLGTIRWRPSPYGSPPSSGMYPPPPPPQPPLEEPGRSEA